MDWVVSQTEMLGHVAQEFWSGLTPLQQSIGGAVAISSSYVLGIHVFGRKGLSRDDPRVIKSRMVGCTIGTAGAVYLFKYLMGHNDPDPTTLLPLLGIRKSGLVPAIVNTIGLTGTLFAGPILQSIIELLSGNNTAIENLLTEENGKLLAFRAYVMAPVTEELVFRACLVPLMRPFFTDAGLTAAVPLFFGFAHAHHLLEKIFILRQDFTSAIIQTVVQLTYTTIFGALSTFMYLKTAQLPAVIAMHTLCNIMGLPDFMGVYMMRSRFKKILVELAYLAGMIGFFYGCTLIKPEHYSNTVFY